MGINGPIFINFWLNQLLCVYNMDISEYCKKDVSIEIQKKPRN